MIEYFFAVAMVITSLLLVLGGRSMRRPLHRTEIDAILMHLPQRESSRSFATLLLTNSMV